MVTAGTIIWAASWNGSRILDSLKKDARDDREEDVTRIMKRLVFGAALMVPLLSLSACSDSERNPAAEHRFEIRMEEGIPLASRSPIYIISPLCSMPQQTPWRL